MGLMQNEDVAKPSGFDIIRQEMRDVLQQAREQRNIDLGEIIEALEPLFQTYGYRDHEEGAPLKILLLTDSGVGDFINCAPAIRAVREELPEAYITLVVYVRSRDLAMACPYVDQLLVNSRSCDWKDPMALFAWDVTFAEKLLPMHFDICFNLAHYGSTILLSYLSGAAHRVGMTQRFSLIGPFQKAYVEGLLTEHISGAVRGMHMVYNYLPTIEEIMGHRVEDPRPEVWFSPQEKQRFETALQERAPGATWFAVVLGGTDGRRHWSVSSYKTLLEQILNEEKEDIHFLILGGPENKDESDWLESALPAGRAWNGAGAWNYRESVAALSCCKLYLGNDTGLMHAAGAAGLPVLSPNCFPADCPMDDSSNPLWQRPYGVPAVFVLPAKALPECKDSADAMGCAEVGRSHCIRTITSAHMLAGYHLLKEQMQKGSTEQFFLFGAADALEPGKTVIRPLSEVVQSVRNA